MCSSFAFRARSWGCFAVEGWTTQRWQLVAWLCLSQPNRLPAPASTHLHSSPAHLRIMISASTSLGAEEQMVV